MSSFYLAPTNEKSFYNKAVVSLAKGIATLKSYDTKVASYNTVTKVMTIKGWYSSTTARHINAFLEYYSLDTMTKKQMIQASK